MKKNMTRFAAFAMAALMTASMVGCGTASKKAAETTTEAAVEASTEMASMVNPVSSVTEEEMVEKTGIDLPAPDGAEDVSYSVIDTEDGMTAQMEFTLDGETMYLRAVPTGITDIVSVMTSEKEEGTDMDASVGDISGFYYTWAQKETQSVQGRDAVALVSEEGPGYIAWVDVVPGILYNLCMYDNASVDALNTFAEKAFSPLQGDSDEAEAEVEEETINVEFVRMAEAIEDAKADDEASLETAYKEICNIMETYGEELTLQSMEAFAAEVHPGFVELYGENFEDGFLTSLQAVADYAVKENPDLETDATFSQIVNGLTNQFEAMK